MAWWFWFGVSREIAANCQPGLQSSEDLTGVGDEAFKMFYSHGCQLEKTIRERQRESERAREKPQSLL